MFWVPQVAEADDGEETDRAWRKFKEEKPHILITAPSNVAVDNIILRIIEDGFIDGQGRRYNPAMVRIGRGQSERVRAVSLDQLVDDFMRENEQVLKHRVQHLHAELTHHQQILLFSRAKLRALIREIKYPISKDWNVTVGDDLRIIYINHFTKSTSNHIPPPPPPNMDPNEAKLYVRLEQLPEHIKLAQEVTSLVEFVENKRLELGRCETRLQAIYSQQVGAVDDFQVRQNLETSIIDAAHLVFTTLNSAGSASLANGGRFSVVVTDEAAQAIEPSTLIPLQLGAVNCVLVGDPQQLPATVFSKSNDLAFERSLFERLEQGGHPVHLLDTQYRMHPKISAFPRRHFYGSLLKDGDNVLQDPSYNRSYHRFEALQPFTFLNLRSHVATSGGVSWKNPDEGRLIINIFQTLKQIAPDDLKGGKVGVITPYALQLRELRNQFHRALGPAYQEEVELNTVDGFQGKEKDIIMISCVRASGSRGIGFLADIRRLNVGLTRGKYAVIMVGREDVLRQNEHWAALLNHAKETKAFVEVPGPTCDLLQLRSWIPGDAPPRDGGGGRGGGRGPRGDGRDGRGRQLGESGGGARGRGGGDSRGPRDGRGGGRDGGGGRGRGGGDGRGPRDREGRGGREPMDDGYRGRGPVRPLMPPGFPQQHPHPQQGGHFPLQDPPRPQMDKRPLLEPPRGMLLPPRTGLHQPLYPPTQAPPRGPPPEQRMGHYSPPQQHQPPPHSYPRPP